MEGRGPVGWFRARVAVREEAREDGDWEQGLEAEGWVAGDLGVGVVEGKGAVVKAGEDWEVEAWEGAGEEEADWEGAGGEVEAWEGVGWEVETWEGAAGEVVAWEEEAVVVNKRQLLRPYLPHR